MKLILVFLCFVFHGAHAQNKLYDLSMKSADGDSILLSGFKGVNILVAVSTDEYLQKRGMTFLDSLTREFPRLQILIFPATDIGDQRVVDSTLSKKFPDNKQLTMASRSAVGSEKLPKSPVVKFVTEVEENTHFDLPIISDFQLYIIDELGELCAVMTNKFPLKALDEILRHQTKGLRNNQREPFN